MRGRWVAAVLAAVLTTTGTAIGTVVATRAGEALPGTTVAGRDVGGQDRDALRATVRSLAAARTTGEMTLTAAGTSLPLDRSVTTVDVAATVGRALDAGRDVPVLGALVGHGQAVPLALEVDPAGVRRAVAALAEQVDRPADDGGFTVEGVSSQGVTVQPRQPVEGRAVDTGPALAAVTAALRQGAPSVAVPILTTAPTTTAEDVAAVVAAANRSLSGPYAVGTGAEVLRVTAPQIAPLLRAVAVDGALALRVDVAGLTAALSDQAGALEAGAREAGFQVVSDAPTVDTKGDLAWTPLPAQVQVTPGQAGRAVDLPAATARLAAQVLAGQHAPAGALPLRVVEPDLTTAAARAAGVRNLIGAFTTYYPAGRPRARNIQRIAQLVDGTYIPAGAVLSLNDTAGERTLARGFVADGAIVDGELTDEVGGGVSQFATTLFNASFFAGLAVLEHKPHSFYISRYPAGRESTVYFGALDVRIRNDTAHGMLVRTSSTAGSVTVELYGDNGGRRVTSTTSARRPRPDGGFDITVTRMTTGGDGVGGRRVFTTSYNPAPAGH